MFAVRGPVFVVHSPVFAAHSLVFAADGPVVAVHGAVCADHGLVVAAHIPVFAARGFVFAVRGLVFAAHVRAIAVRGPVDAARDRRFVSFPHLSSVAVCHVLQAKGGRKQPSSTVSGPTEVLGICLQSLVFLHGKLHERDLPEWHGPRRFFVPSVDLLVHSDRKVGLSISSFSQVATAVQCQKKANSKTK